MPTIFMVSLTMNIFIQLNIYNIIFKILYFQLVNMYTYNILGSYMSEYLPVDGFEWVKEELTETDIMNKPKDDST